MVNENGDIRYVEKEIFFMWKEKIFTELSNLLSSNSLSREGYHKCVWKMDSSWIFQ